MKIGRQKCFRSVNFGGIRPPSKITRIFLMILQNISDGTYLFPKFCGSPLSLLGSSLAADVGNASKKWEMETFAFPFNTPAGSKYSQDKPTLPQKTAVRRTDIISVIVFLCVPQMLKPISPVTIERNPGRRLMFILPGFHSINAINYLILKYIGHTIFTPCTAPCVTAATYP